MSGRVAGAFCFALVCTVASAGFAIESAPETVGAPIGVPSNATSIPDAQREPSPAFATTAGGRPDVAPWLLPEDWFGRPAAKAPLHTWQRQKSPRTALFSSLLVPGLGQLYNEREFWAMVAAGVEFYFIGTIVAEQRQMDRWLLIANTTNDVRDRVQYLLHRDNRTQATWLLGLSALLSGLQSYVDAHMSDFDDSPLPIRAVVLPDAGAGAALHWRF